MRTSKTTKTVAAERFELKRSDGRVVVEACSQRGRPYVILWDGRRKIRAWLTFRVDGAPDVRFFGKKLGKK